MKEPLPHGWWIFPMLLIELILCVIGVAFVSRHYEYVGVVAVFILVAISVFAIWR